MNSNKRRGELLSYYSVLAVFKDIEGNGPHRPPLLVPMPVNRLGPSKCYFEFQHKWERVLTTTKAQYLYCQRCEMYRVHEMELSELLPVVNA